MKIRSQLRWLLRPVVVIAGAALFAVACRDDAGGPAQQPPLSNSEAQLIGREVAGEVEGIANSFTAASFLTGSLPGRGDVGPDGPLVFPITPGCPVIEPFPPPNQDGDHVPDDVTLRFTLPACRVTRGDITFEITGSVRIQDLDPLVAGFGVRFDFDALQHKITSGPAGGERFHLWRLNGERTLERSGGSFSAHENTTTALESSEAPSAELVKMWDVDFVAAAGQSVDHSRRLPSGLLTVNGSSTWTQGERQRSFAVTTVDPLFFDAACRGQITDGELLITATRNGETWRIRIVFNPCGVPPTVTRESA